MTALLTAYEIALLRAGDAAEAKAVTGPGANVYAAGGVPMSSLLSMPGNHRRWMEQAQDLYWSHPWIRAAESLIDKKFSTAGYRVMTASTQDEEDRETVVHSGDVVDLLKAGAPLQGMKRRALWHVTCRHAGLCNNAFWFLDQIDMAQGRPLQVIYVNPVRMTPVPDASGYLDWWALDWNPETGQAATRLSRDEVLWFQMEPADKGFLGYGLVWAALMKAQLSKLTDSHAIHTLAGGGRFTGIISPKEGETLSNPQFETAQKELRNVTELDDSAKRVVLLRKPIELTKTTMTPSELDLLGLARMSRDDIYEIWGVPRSQTGGMTEIGMNSGERQSYEEAALQQNAVHPRVAMFEETVNQLLSRFGKFELEIDEPTFDDERPKYEMLKLSEYGALSRDERRALLGKPPLKDKKMGAIVEQTPGLLQIIPEMPLARSMITGRLQDGSAVEPITAQQPTAWAQITAVQDARQGNEPAVPVNPRPLVPPVGGPVTPRAPLAGKATTVFAAKAAARSIGQWSLYRDVANVLRAVAETVIAKIEPRYAHLAAKKAADMSAIFSEKAFAESMLAALLPHARFMAAEVTGAIRSGSAKAETDGLDATVDGLLAAHVAGMASWTTERLKAIIGPAIEAGEPAAVVSAAIREAAIFDEVRAAKIAHSETSYVLNAAQNVAYKAMDVPRVLVTDGDGDAVCAAANGAEWTLDEMAANLLGHPDCSRDFIPVYEPAAAKADFDAAVAEAAAVIVAAIPPLEPAPPPWAQLAETLAAMPSLMPAPQKLVRRVVERDADQRIVGIVDVPLGDA